MIMLIISIMTKPSKLSLVEFSPCNLIIKMLHCGLSSVAAERTAGTKRNYFSRVCIMNMATIQAVMACQSLMRGCSKWR
jgi:hypothetical protein